MKCNYCGSEPSMTQQGMLRHVTRYCKSLKECDRIDRWMKAVACVYHQTLANHDELTVLYCVKKLSILDIAKQLSCNHLMVHRALEKHGIPKRTQSESRKLVQYKTEATCIKKYGASNPLSKGTTPEQNRNSTVLERYGVKNVFQEQSIRDSNIQKMRRGGLSYEKRMLTFLKRYGTKSQFGRSEVRAKVNQSFLIKKNGRYISKLNQRAYSVLKEKKISYEPEFMITSDGRTFSYDLKIGNTLIELNGDHWHANPKRFKANDVVMVPKQTYLASEQWNRDAHKVDVAKRNGFDVITLWESDLNHDFEGTLISALKVKV